LGATNWLKRTVPEFGELSDKERKAIKDFALLWSLFEGTTLKTHANARAIIQMVDEIRDRKDLTLVPFRDAISHFRHRYYDGHNFTAAFENLHFRNGDQRPVAEDFVADRAADDAATLSGLLIIIYRLRNNLFHGVKWAYGIRGQFDNFRHANDALIGLMELHR
jgi:hypothetical protein